MSVGARTLNCFRQGRVFFAPCGDGPGLPPVDGKSDFHATKIPWLGIELFGERIQELLLAGIFGAHGHVVLIVPCPDGLSDREADDLL